MSQNTYKYSRKYAATSTPEEDEEILAANAAIKSSLDLLIQEMSKGINDAPRLLKKAIAKAEKERIQKEVEELLADEQRSTVMGQWA